MAHGSRYHRRPGSMGPGADPIPCIQREKTSRTNGWRQITVQNLEVVKS